LTSSISVVFCTAMHMQTQVPHRWGTPCVPAFLHLCCMVASQLAWLLLSRSEGLVRRHYCHWVVPWSKVFKQVLLCIATSEVSNILHGPGAVLSELVTLAQYLKPECIWGVGMSASLFAYSLTSKPTPVLLGGAMRFASLLHAASRSDISTRTAMAVRVPFVGISCSCWSGACKI
jgi:hypothetical protein